MQKGEHQTIPQLQDQVPIGFQEGKATNKEAEDHIQGQKAQLVYVMWVTDELQVFRVSLSGVFW